MDEVQQKQKYLCDNVLEAGYDGQDFAEYCEREMGNMDIASWTFPQLEQLVGRYVESKQTNVHTNHEASFIDYQQQEEVPPARRSPPHHEPIQDIPSNGMVKKKDAREASPLQRDPPPPPQYRPDPNVEELFKDPFTKKEKSVIAAPNWGTGSWGAAGKPAATSPAPAKQFNFMDLLGPTTTSATSSPIKAVTTANISNSPPVPMVPQGEYQLKAPAYRPPQPATKPQPKPIEPFQPIKIDGKQNITDMFNNFATLPSNNNSNNAPNIRPVPVPVPVPKSYVGPAATSSKPVGNINIFQMNIDDAPVHRANQSEPVITNLSGVLPSFEQKKMSESNVRSMSQTMSVVDIHSSAVHGGQRSKSQSKSKVVHSGTKVVQQEFYDIIPCAKAHLRTLLSTPHVQVLITGHEIVNRNFFVPDYVLYHILTKGLNVQVKRKYAHFVRLRNMLCKFYPGYRVPYLEKNPWLSETDPQHIRRQKVMIELFMNDILMNKQFRNCRIVQEFLTLEYKKLKAKLQEYDKLARLKSLEELCLLTGEVNIAYSDQHRIYCDGMNPFLQNMNHHMDKYKRLQEQLTANYSSLIRTYTEVQEVMVAMQATVKSFNANVGFGEFYEMEQTINSLNETYREMSNSIRFDGKVLEAEVKPLWRFEKENLGTIREQLDIRNKMTEAYSRNHQLTSEPYANNSKLAAFKLAAEEPSKHPTVLKYQNGYYNAQVVMENMRLFKDLSTKLNARFALIAGQYEERKIEEIHFWQRKKVNGVQMQVQLPV